MFLGRLAYLDGKPEGDKSMPGKRWPSGGVQGGVPQDPRDMAKAGLLEVDRPGDLGGSEPWEDSESCLHSGSTPRSCASAR